MADILDDLRAYLAGENRIIMSPKRINEMIAAFDGLRAELAAEKQRAAELRAWRDDATMACAKRRCSTVLRDRDEAEAERDALCELLREAYKVVSMSRMHDGLRHRMSALLER